MSGKSKNLEFAACEPFFTGYARLSIYAEDGSAWILLLKNFRNQRKFPAIVSDVEGECND
jgi:hypothetical protein